MSTNSPGVLTPSAENLLGNLRHAVVLKDDEGRILFVNDRALEVLGAQKKDIVGKTDFDLFPHELAAKYREDDLGVLSTGATLMDVEELVTSDGRIAHVEIIKSPIEEDGKITGVKVEFWDVTDKIQRQEAEAALSESEGRMRQVAEALGDAVWDFNAVTGEIWRNDAHLELFGIPKGASLEEGRKRWEDSIDAREREVVKATFQQALDNPNSSRWIRDFSLTREGGKKRFVHEVVHLTRDADGKLERVIGSIRDLTEMRIKQEEAAEQEANLWETQKLESLGVLAGGIAHDFNNLLTSILGNINLAREDIGKGHPSHPMLLEVEHSSLRAADLCKQMLAYSGKGQFVIRAVQLREFIMDMDGLLQMSIAKKARLTYDFDPELLPIAGDPSQMQQIVMNLIINASEALPGGKGEIRVSTQMAQVTEGELGSCQVACEITPGPVVQLDVIDTGCGMSEETLQRIFEPFFTTKFTGRGLGLAAVIGIIRGHGGTFKVQSRVGEGTSFRIYLPPARVLPEQRVSAKPTRPTTRPQGQGRVLVVDDEVLVRKTAARILKKAGYQVVLASDGREGVAAFLRDQKETDLVLLDLTMPEMDGVEACREILEIKSGTPIVIMSGYSEQDTVEKFSGEPLAGFVQKPFRPMTLIDTVQEILEDSRL